jgi:hypothetical protein
LQLAHAVTTSGANIEMLLLAVGLFVLGVVLFVQKSVKPVVPLVLVLFAIAAGGGAFALGDTRPHSHTSSATAGAAPSGLGISIVTPEDGSTVSSDEQVAIEVNVRGGELVTAATSDNPRAGHLHIYVDGVLASMVSRSSAKVDVGAGEHAIQAEFTTADHRSFDPPVIDSIVVTAE